MYCGGPACLLALLLVLTVQGLEVVARVRFSQSHYIVKEQGPQICVDVINELSPATTYFVVSYSFSTTLTGTKDPLIQATRNDLLYISPTAVTTELCIPHEDDSIPCEDDIVGTLRLLNSSTVLVGNPASAVVTIQDDDYEYATFDKALYTVVEGAHNIPSPTINVTVPTDTVRLQITQAPRITHGMVEYSLNFPSTEVSLEQKSQQISLNIHNDNIALEDTEAVVLEMGISSQTSCANVKLSPRNSTTILIVDDDTVTVALTNSRGIVQEGERYEVCVTLSKIIARTLSLQLRVHSETADMDDLELTSDIITVDFSPFSDNLKKCIKIATLQDNVLEDDEFFRLELSDHTILPTSIQGNLILGTTTSTITIQDTSTCTGVVLNTDSTIYVHEGRTLCFSCSSCSADIYWNITSYQNINWGGRTGGSLQSESSDRGVVLLDGTLQVTNSSLLFSQLIPGIVRFTELPRQNNNRSSDYKVFIGEEAEVTELSIETTNDIIRITCLYRGTPEPQLDWLVRSEPVNERNIIVQVDSEGESYFKSTLLVNRTIAENFRTYTCRASNHLGADSSDVSISPPDHNNSSSLNSSNDLSHFTSYICLISLVLFHFL